MAANVGMIVALLFLPLTVASEVRATSEDAFAAAAALAADEVCDSDNEDGNACAVNAMQLRGQKVRSGVVRDEMSNGTIYGHPSASAKYPSYPGFTLVLVEEFASPIDLDSDPIWTWSDGGLIEGQIRFAKEGISFEDGKMKVTVRAQPATDAQTCSNAEAVDIKPKELTSGEMRTKHNMFRYGRYEVSMKAPEVQPGDALTNGNYVATFFVFRDAKYKHWREIDFEITGDATGSVTTNVLSADDTAQWKNGIQEDVNHVMDFNTRQKFHTYAFEWLPTSIKWYIDGKLVREKKAAGGVRIPDLSGKIMMNMWMFDDRALFGGPEIKNNRYPMHSEYEWVRFYKWDGDKDYPCAGMGTGCLNADDNYLSANNPCDGIPQVGTVYDTAACHATCHAPSASGPAQGPPGGD